MLKNRHTSTHPLITIAFVWILFLFPLHKLFAGDLLLNPACQALLTDPEKGLVSTPLDNYDYSYADRNANAIMNALKRLGKNQDLLLPEGSYYVNPILIARTISDCTIAGAGIKKTVLKRSGFSWDNNTQGDCPLRTEVFITDNVNGLELLDMTIDGNCHHIAISGYGTWNTSNGSYSNGLPQFPTYISDNDYRSSGGSVVNICLSKKIKFENIEFKNAYRWCILLGKVNDFTMRNCIIDTGNLSTEFKGHFDPSPNNTVMHMHTSQDGLHLVNVSNALIEYNDIHSEDSAIAVELNPAWNWGGYDITENIVIKNNYISTASPEDAGKLLNDDDVIYGTGLANAWTGQSAVDIFYNENWDIPGNTHYRGQDYFRNIEIKENAFEGVRQGVRCGFFIGATLGHFNHRIYNLVIKDHEPSFLAGRNRNEPAGIRSVTKNTYAGSWNLSGGAGIAVRYTDSLIVSNNVVERVSGGLGLSIENVSRFELTNNKINDISGTQLGDLGTSWVGGEGIRINNKYLQNDPNWKNNYFDAGHFLVENNHIGQVETAKITVVSTGNGIVKLNRNYDMNGTRLCELDDGISKNNTQNIDWGDCNGTGISATNSNPIFNFFPNPVRNYLYIYSQTPVKENTHIKILNIKGEKIFAGQLIPGINVISTKQLSSGVYILAGGNNIQQTHYRFIKK
jgi:hypothetical protein